MSIYRLYPIVKWSIGYLFKTDTLKLKVLSYIIALLFFTVGCSSDDEVSITSGPLDLPSTIEHLYSPNSNYVLIASHRGDATKAPENTIAAIEAAITSGAEIVEIDVRITQDGVLVVIHDTTLERTTNGTGNVVDRPLSYIQSLKTKDSNGNLTEHGVPTLFEVMAFAKDKTVIFIDKGNDYWPEIQNVLRETDTFENTLIVEPYSLSRAKNELNGFYDRIHYVPRIRQTDEDAFAIYNEFKPEVIPGFEFRFTTENSSVFSLIPEATQQGNHIWMSTITPDMTAGRTDLIALDDPDASWGWCVDNGASIILTSYPELLNQYLSSRNLRQSDQ